MADIHTNINSLEEKIKPYMKYSSETPKNDVKVKTNTNTKKKIDLKSMNLYYISIPFVIFILLAILKPGFVMKNDDENIEDEEADDKISIFKLFLSSIIISFILIAIFEIIKKYLK